MVTGATSGIGKVTARELSKQGAVVVIVGRSGQRAEATAAEIRAAGGEQVEIMLADLTSMVSIRALAQDFRAKYTRLDVLVNNAGAVFTSRQTSPDGLEMTFALNHISYFLLTYLLRDVLTATPGARVVNVSSDAHYGGKINFDDLQPTRGYSGFGVYANTKLMNVLFTYELARQLEGSGVTANALHPGLVATNFSRNNGWLMNLFWSMISPFALSVEQGAQTSLYLASSPEVEGVSGQYFDKRAPKRSSADSYNRETQRRLWQVSEQLCGLPITVA
jgi:NAD(P)-dependent dehydrogenase (short-subunit alcohol dehydrogenase family)